MAEYLRYRPFMTIRFFEKNGQKLEEVGYYSRVNTKHELENDIIIDLSRGNFVKNRMKDVDQEALLNNYYKKYNNEIVNVVTDYFKDKPEELEKALVVINKRNTIEMKLK